MGNSEKEVLQRERELYAAPGGKTFGEWIKGGDVWVTYPTGYNEGKPTRVGDLTPEQREQLAAFHRRAAQYHQDQAFHYLKYKDGDKGGPAQMGL